MDLLPEALYGTAAVREADRRAMAQTGVDGGGLMERAGSEAFRLIRERYPRAHRWRVVCGPGNNGGDGYVIARLARDAGLDAAVLLPAEPRTGSQDAQYARARWLKTGGSEQRLGSDALTDADVIIDALFGVGIERPLEGAWLDAVRWMNGSRRPVAAIDVPSGLHADCGRVQGEAVRAAATVTFIGLKAGLFTGEGREHAGEILFADLGASASVFHGLAPLARRLTETSLTGLLVPRPRHAHKGDAGRVLIIGGQPGMSGAIRLAGEGAYRAGAGLVTVATHPIHTGTLSGACAELITTGLNNPGELEALMERASVIAVGPGLGTGAWALGLFELAVRSAQPLVIDADALNLLAQHPQTRPDWILTPHPGEAARLLNCSITDVQADRFTATREIVARYGGVCVLKGSGTLVADASGDSPWLCDRGNPGMASGGTGDVLTGMIAALRAQGLSAIESTRLAVWAHATAGDRAGKAGERGLMAHDLLPVLRTILNEAAIG